MTWRIAPVLALFFPLTALGGSSLSVGSLTVDGLELIDIQCDLTQGGLFASMAVGAELASKKATYDACHPAGAALRLSWKWADGATEQVVVVASSEPKADACMVKAMRTIASRQSGTCAATLLIGDPTVARAAATSLAAPVPPVTRTDP